MFDMSLPCIRFGIKYGSGQKGVVSCAALSSLRRAVTFMSKFPEGKAEIFRSPIVFSFVRSVIAALTLPAPQDSRKNRLTIEAFSGNLDQSKTATAALLGGDSLSKNPQPFLAQEIVMSHSVSEAAARAVKNSQKKVAETRTGAEILKGIRGNLAAHLAVTPSDTAFLLARYDEAISRIRELYGDERA